ncbi:hypothetical protein JTE90_015424 [Oedothorax gibbosus]|uniref:Cytochrome P450 n=1 Tax=Oedothorax gibbosus TaxID=931172 RepID=A0AAV6TZI0_9ARAC|nr:hypothetical protein JTE90_015424 [Oedothorax gibbosus]
MLHHWISGALCHISPTSQAIAITTLVFILIYYFNYYRTLPPGPLGLPYFGYWPFLSDKNCYSQLKGLRKKYGDFYSFTSTAHLNISLGSFKVLREAHITKSDCFVGRFEDYNLLTAIFADGVGFKNGEGYKILRKFFLQSFKERGVLTINDAVADSILESAKSAVAELKLQIGVPVDILQLLIDKCSYILRDSLFGESGLVTEEQIKSINAHFGTSMECMTATNLLLTGNIARYLILPFTSGYREFRKSHKLIQRCIYKIIEDHKSTYKEDHIRDIIDEYIKERKFQGNHSAQYFTDKALMSTLIQLIGDGVLSIAALIALFFKILLEHPEEQDKIHMELVEVLGEERQPTLGDRNRLPYTNAFLLEAMRTSVFFPFFPSLQCCKETTIRGYRIPVGTITLINTWSTHNDPDIYEDPETFNPSRFLDLNNSRKPELPITFGVGKRSCVAENFTMLQVFIFLTTIIKNFHIKLVKDSQEKNEPAFSGKLLIMVQLRS